VDAARRDTILLCIGLREAERGCELCATWVRYIMTMCNAPTGTFTGTILENDSDSFVPLFIFLLFHIPRKASSMYPYERRSLFPTGPSTGAATHLAREVLLLPWNEKEFFRFPPNIESAKNILCLPRSTWTEKEFGNVRSSEVKDTSKILFINGVQQDPPHRRKDAIKKKKKNGYFSRKSARGGDQNTFTHCKNCFHVVFTL